MVTGLDLFRAHFRDYADRYLLIGGVACDLLLTAAGAAFRATKDFDIVVCAETIDKAFVQAFWMFVRSGQYASSQKSTGQRQYYRFQKPADSHYPFMLELFSRVPDSFEIASGSHLTPLHVDDEVSSLSAILMDDEYYAFIRAGRTIRDGLPVVGAEHLIPLKARAWLDLKLRKESGEPVDGKSIRKHRNDVFRLFQILDPDSSAEPPQVVKRDLQSFIRQVATEEFDLKQLGLLGASQEDVLNGLEAFYQLK